MELYLHNNIVLCKENVTHKKKTTRQKIKKFNIDKTKKFFLCLLRGRKGKKFFQFLQAFCSDIDNRSGSILFARKMSMD